MHKYIERIVNVKSDSNYDYRIVSTLLGKGEDIHTLVRHQLIHELMTHKESYTRLYGKKEIFDAIYESLVLCLSGPASEAKWTRFPEICHLIAYAYDKVCIGLTRYNFLETFFPLHTASPQNLNDRMLCIGWLSKSQHFVQVYLEPGCPIPLTSPEWEAHSTTKIETWSNHFVERMQEFEKLRNIERESNVQNSKGEPPILIDLAGDRSFDYF